MCIFVVKSTEVVVILSDGESESITYILLIAFCCIYSALLILSMSSIDVYRGEQRFFLFVGAIGSAFTSNSYYIAFVMLSTLFPRSLSS